MKNSGIGWTDDTYNPIILEGGGFYCFKVSAGCTNCYAEGVVNRFNHENFVPYKNMKEYPKLALREDMLAGWARKKKPRKNFVSSMTDVFGEFVPDEWVYKILDAMVAAPIQIFQVLTKRSKRMKELVHSYCELRGLNVLPKNIWLIVSVENQDYVSRAVDLVATRCQIRGLSIEPMLDYVNLALVQNLTKWVEMGTPGVVGERPFMYHTIADTRVIEHMDWVICGGESGPKARLMYPEWPLNLKRQCDIYNVPFFFKQWGEWVGGVADSQTGKIKLECGGWVPYDSAEEGKRLHNWDKKVGNHSYLVSYRAGKKETTYYITDPAPAELHTDNSLFGGKHYYEFPHYLKEAV